MSSPSWLRSTARPQRRHVRGRTSASTSRVRSSTTHTIAQGTRNAPEVVTEVTIALSDGRRGKLTCAEALRWGREPGVRCAARLRRRHSRHRRVASRLCCHGQRCPGAARAGATEVTAQGRSYRPRRLRRERSARPRQPPDHRGSGAAPLARALWPAGYRLAEPGFAAPDAAGGRMRRACRLAISEYCPARPALGSFASDAPERAGALRPSGL